MAGASQHRVLDRNIKRISRNAYIGEIPHDALRVRTNQAGSIPSFVRKLDDDPWYALALSVERKFHRRPRLGKITLASNRQLGAFGGPRTRNGSKRRDR
jgi:hypothetical protein